MSKIFVNQFFNILFFTVVTRNTSEKKILLFMILLLKCYFICVLLFFFQPLMGLKTEITESSCLLFVYFLKWLYSFLNFKGPTKFLSHILNQQIVYLPGMCLETFSVWKEDWLKYTSWVWNLFNYLLVLVRVIRSC